MSSAAVVIGALGVKLIWNSHKSLLKSEVKFAYFSELL